MKGLNHLLSIFSVMDGNDVEPTALIIVICGALFLAVITLTIILAKKNKPKKL